MIACKQLVLDLKRRVLTLLHPQCFWERSGWGEFFYMSSSVVMLTFKIKGQNHTVCKFLCQTMEIIGIKWPFNKLICKFCAPNPKNVCLWPHTPHSTSPGVNAYLYCVLYKVQVIMSAIIAEWWVLLDPALNHTESGKCIGGCASSCMMLKFNACLPRTGCHEHYLNVDWRFLLHPALNRIESGKCLGGNRCSKAFTMGYLHHIERQGSAGSVNYQSLH